MSIESKLSGHWTDDELIRHLYGIGPDGGHIDSCEECQGRLAAAQAHRQMLELSASAEQAVSYDFLTAQRRRIYAKLTEPTRWRPAMWARRWASAAATVLVLGGSVLVYEQKHRPAAANDRISDVQLAQDVSSVALDAEPQPTAPLQALFDE
jgi:hypothetical protein